MSYKRFTKKDRYGHWCTDTKINDRYMWSEDGKVWERDLTHCAFDGEAIDRLAELEDKIENGTMIELKAKVNDTVFWITSNFEIVEAVIIDIKIIEHGIVYNLKEKNGCEYSIFNVELFKTKAEAEKKLEELSKNP